MALSKAQIAGIVVGPIIFIIVLVVILWQVGVFDSEESATFDILVVSMNDMGQPVPLENAVVIATSDNNDQVFTQETGTDGKTVFKLPFGCWTFSCDTIITSQDNFDNTWKKATLNRCILSSSDETVQNKTVELIMVRNVNPTPLISTWDIIVGEELVSVKVKGKGQIDWGDNTKFTAFDSVEDLIDVTHNFPVGNFILRIGGGVVTQIQFSSNGTLTGIQDIGQTGLTSLDNFCYASSKLVSCNLESGDLSQVTSAKRAWGGCPLLVSFDASALTDNVIDVTQAWNDFTGENNNAIFILGDTFTNYVQLQNSTGWLPGSDTNTSNPLIPSGKILSQTPIVYTVVASGDVPGFPGVPTASPIFGPNPQFSTLDPTIFSEFTSIISPDLSLNYIKVLYSGKYNIRYSSTVNEVTGTSVEILYYILKNGYSLDNNSIQTSAFTPANAVQLVSLELNNIELVENDIISIGASCLNGSEISQTSTNFEFIVELVSL